MGRNFAGVLGPLAFAAVLIRGALKVGGFENTLAAACLALWVFSAIGYLTGRIAAWIVEDSVTTKVSAELEAQERANKTEGRAAVAS